MSRIKLLVITLTVLVSVIILTGFKVNSDIHSAEFCGGCHQMKPHVYTWETATHSKINCITCHGDVPVLSYIYRNWRYKLATGKEKPPVHKKLEIKDDVCLQCHTKNREVTPPGDLKVAHQLHTKKKIDCVDCHNNVVHADVLEKLSTNELSSITRDRVKKLAEEQRLINENKCLRCHNGEKAANKCETCHKDLKDPASRPWIKVK